MTVNFILFLNGTKLCNRQTINIVTLFTTRVKYIVILEEQFTGLVVFSFTLFILVYQLSKLVFFLDTCTYKKTCTANTYIYLILVFAKPIATDMHFREL